MNEVFTAAEIDDLSAEIDRQLLALRESKTVVYRSGDELGPDGALSEQRAAIEHLTQEPKPNF